MHGMFVIEEAWCLEWHTCESRSGRGVSHQRSVSRHVTQRWPAALPWQSSQTALCKMHDGGFHTPFNLSVKMREICGLGHAVQTCCSLADT